MTTDIAAIFTNDPRNHTDADIVALIQYLRENRHKFIVDGNKQAGSMKSVTAVQKKMFAAVDKSIGDLDL